MVGHVAVPSATPMADRVSWRTFLVWTAFTWAGALVLILGSMAALFWRAGEFRTTASFVAEQARTGGLYRTVSIDAVMSPGQRLERLAILQPKVITLGSSRVLQFRASHFTKPFTNMGMSFDLPFFPQLAEAIGRRAKVEVVILSLDHWQFYPTKVPSPPRQFDGFSWREALQEVREIRAAYIAAPLNMISNLKLGV